MNEEKKLSEKINEQEELLKKIAEKVGVKTDENKSNEPLKSKPFRLPFKIRAGYKKNIKKGKILVLWQYENRNSTFKWHETEFNSYLDDNKIPRIFGEKDIRFLDGKIPYIIQPVNDIKPLDMDFKQQKADDAEVAGILIKWLEKSRLEQAKNKLNFSWIIILIIVIIVVYIIYKYIAGG